jgi:hypothetical protein
MAYRFNRPDFEADGRQIRVDSIRHVVVPIRARTKLGIC